MASDQGTLIHFSRPLAKRREVSLHSTPAILYQRRLFVSLFEAVLVDPTVSRRRIQGASIHIAAIMYMKFEVPVVVKVPNLQCLPYAAEQQFHISRTALRTNANLLLNHPPSLIPIPPPPQRKRLLHQVCISFEPPQHHYPVANLAVLSPPTSFATAVKREPCTFRPSLVQHRQNHQHRLLIMPSILV